MSRHGRIGHNSSLDQLPIPEDVRPGPGWTEQMVEMADHIGPYKTMLIVEKYGGQQIYISADPARNVLRDLIGAAAAATMSHVYRRERLEIPTAKYAVARARRRSLIARCRANELTITEAARILGTSRTYLSELVNNSDEATDDEAEPPRGRYDIPGQMQLFGEDEAE
ncbi:MAG: hypothetical protein QOI38_2062 [Sphingomonadales bacterium]|jgi:hypothetical protein|nr:hypothetical protein [Sphingomonadales bacterium]